MRRIFISSVATALIIAGAGLAEAGWEEGVAAFRSGNFTQAAKEFQAIVQERPEWPGGHFMLGQSLLKIDRSQDALTHLRKAYDLNPNDVSYQLALAKAYVDNKAYSNAVQLLDKIDENALSAGQQAAFHELSSVAYERSGQTDRALEALARTAGAKPQDANVQYRYGLALFNAGQTRPAVAALDKAIQLDPGDLDKKVAYVKVMIRSARELRGDAKQAAYRKALPVAREVATKRATYDHLLTLGEVQLGAQDYRGAISSFNQASSKNGGDWLVHFYTGQALTSVEDYAAAESALTKALSAAPGDRQKRQVWSQIGFVNEKLKDYEAAKEAYLAAGNSAGVARVEENARIAAENRTIEEENALIEQMQREQEALEKELEDLPGSGNPPPR